MQKKTIDQWINQGRKSCKSFVFYQNKVLDLTQFMTSHPGGIKAIKNYVYKDITNIIFQVFPHQKDTTLRKLMKYQIGLIPEEQVSNLRHKNDKITNHTDHPKQKKKVCFNSDKSKMLIPSRVGNNPMTDSVKKSMSGSKRKDPARQSTHKSNSSKGKSKNKQFVTSIRLINQQKDKTYDDYFQQNQQKLRQKQRSTTQKRKDKKQRSILGSCSFINNELDEGKPNFRVPVLCVKHMNKYQ